MAVDLAIDADLAGFLRRIEGLSDAASDEAREIARAFDRGLSGITTSSSRVTDLASADFSQLGNVAEKALKKMGAAGNEVADVLFDFAGPLAEITSGLGSAGVAATVAGGALTAMGLAAAGTVYGLVSITNAAADARDRLTEAGLAAVIPDTASESLDRYERAQGRLTNATDRLVLRIADEGGLIDAVVGLTNATTGLVTVVDHSVGSVLRLAGAAVDFAGVIAPLVSIVDPFAGSLLATTAAAGDLYDSLIVVGTADTSLESVLGAERFRISDEAVTQFAGSFEGKLAPAVAKTNAEIDQTADLLAQIRKATPPVMGQFKGLTVAEEEIGLSTQRMNEQFEWTAESTKALAAASLEFIGNIGAGVEQITGDIVASFEARAAAGEALTEKEKRAARTALIANKAAAISQIIVSAAQAYGGFVAAFSALGPGAPFAAAALVASGMIAPIAAVLGESIPVSFLSSGGGGGGGEPGVPPTGVGPAPDQGSNYKDDDNTDNKAPGFVGGGNTARSSSSAGGEVAITIVFPGGRVGKRRIY